ncbi:MAG TPA: TIGR02186 family protein [Bauldia sp.]|nr:TIGR02186 family protein [Bauldia sp.]
MRPALLFILVAVIASPAAAERLTVAVSTPEVMINSNFTGTPITVFGVIEQDASRPAVPDAKYNVAILVLGPNESVVARRKDRVVGIWLNHAARTIGAAPSFYDLETNVPADALANPAVLQRLQIGFDNIGFVFDGRTGASDPESAEFRDAFLRLKREDGLYTETSNVSFVGNLIFRSTAFLPANIPVGRYSVLAYVFADGELIAHAQDRIEVSKTGFEGSMARFARSQSLLYGLICAALAVFVGWTGGVIFRRD